MNFFQSAPVSKLFYKALVGGSILSLLTFKSLKVIPAGHVGIVDTFGNVKNELLDSGLHFVNPFSKVKKVSLKTCSYSTNLTVPSSEGLLVELASSVLYHLKKEKVIEVYKTIGLDYQEVMLGPQLNSAIRSVSSKYDAKAFYTSSDRNTMKEDLKKELTTLIGDRGFIIEDIPFKNVKLPEKLTKSIEMKLSSEQESERMVFVLEKEKLEAERKRIEAQGISDFQKIVSEGISPALLTWKGIEATEKLSESQNSKVIVIGGGSNGLPIILNTNDNNNLLQQIENKFK